MVLRGKVGNSQHFPTNLHILLDEAEKADHSHIVSWCAQGSSFKIHDQEALVPLLAKYFRQTKFKSFLRQLQSYGFHRTTRGCDKGIVSHPYFVRGRRSLCYRMTRKPSGTAATHMALSRQNTNSSENLDRALPGNILPIRKIQSAPMGFKNAMLPNGGIFTDMSKLKNAAFAFNPNSVAGELGSGHLQSMNSYQVNKVPSSLMPKRRSSTTAANKIRRASDPAISMTSEQREGILKCAEIDYRPGSPVRRPQNGFLLSIKESTSAPMEVPSQQQQQFSFQVQPEQHREPLPLHAMQQQQDQNQIHRVIQVPQNHQVQIQQMQYQEQAQAPRQHVCMQYSSGQQLQRQPQHVVYTKYEVEPSQAQPQQAPQVDNVYSHQQVEKVYSQQEVADKINRAREDMAKHFQQQLLSNKLQAQYRQQAQQGQHQVGTNGVQNQQHVPQECEQPEQYHQVPQADNSCAPSACCDPTTQPLKTSSMYAPVPSNNFELSFSTSEFTNVNNNVAKSTFPSLAKAPLYVPSNNGANCSSFSVAISTPLGRLAPPNAMGMPPRVNAAAYNRSTAELRPINIQEIHSSRAEPIQHTSAEVCGSINEGTVDFLLQTGDGGCEEWDMPAEEVAEGLNYYGFLNTPDVATEVSSTESCHQPEHVHIHHSHPIPINTTCLYNRQ